MVRSLPKWLRGSAGPDDEGVPVRIAVSTNVVDDCQLRLVSNATQSRKAEMMNIMNTCQAVYLLLTNGERRALRVLTPLSPVHGGGATELFQTFCSWQLLSVFGSDQSCQ